jgi:hypothetical protein
VSLSGLASRRSPIDRVTVVFVGDAVVEAFAAQDRLGQSNHLSPAQGPGGARHESRTSLTLASRPASGRLLLLSNTRPLPRDYPKRGSHPDQRPERFVMARPGFHFQRVDDAKRQSKLFRDMAQRRQF